MRQIEKTTFYQCFYIGKVIDAEAVGFKDPVSYENELRAIYDFCDTNHIATSGHPVSIYTRNSDKKTMTLFIGYPLAEHVVLVGTDYVIHEVKESDTMALLYEGNYGYAPSIRKDIEEAIANESGIEWHTIVEEHLTTLLPGHNPELRRTTFFYLLRQNIEGAFGDSNSLQKIILILEDESILSKALRRFFEKHGFTVIVTDNGNEAMKLVEKYNFDLALLDLLVPGVSGFDVLKRLREKSKAMPIYVLSNLEEQTSRKQAMDLGVTKYFVKSETLLSQVADEISREMGMATDENE